MLMIYLLMDMIGIDNFSDLEVNGLGKYIYLTINLFFLLMFLINM